MMNTKIARYLFSFVVALGASALSAQTHWSLDYHQYQYDMTVYFELQKNSQSLSDWNNFEVAAFVNDECRGVGEFLTASANDQTIRYGYLRVRSNVSSGETVVFKFYDKAQNEEENFYGADVSFVANQAIGYPSNPKVLDIVTHEVTVSANEVRGTASGSGVFYHGKQATVEASANDYYSFSHWTTGTDVLSTDNPYVFTVTKDLSLTAVFSPVDFPIAYELDGGALGTGIFNPITYNIESASFTLNNPQKNGYTFTGWTGTELVGAVQHVTVVQGSIGARSYTATWLPTTYTITYNLNGGTLDEDNPDGYTIESDPITLNNPTREGYVFGGWTGTDLAVATENVSIATGSTGNRSYTAIWIPVIYIIDYVLDGGELPAGKNNPIEYTIESESFTLVNPIKDGFSFAGWEGTGLSEATIDVTIPQGSLGDRSYTATWTEAATMKGDVNKDGVVNIADVAAVLNIMAGNNPGGNDGDVNADGVVNIADVAAVLNIMAGN